ncbi:MAG: FHA domain-containing protein [Actinobacteria bacterium]|nr:FHA domain-containing protein [Actinomycetota bacterium]
MPDLVLDLLKYAFLVILYIFVARAVRAVFLELRPQTAPRRARPAEAPAPPPAPQRRGKKAPKKAAVIEGENLRGKSFDLGEELTIGRADKCSVILDDPYVSQFHARIFQKGEGVAVEDMGSTNGTYLNRQRITSPAELQRGDRLKIGKTVLELRK